MNEILNQKKEEGEKTRKLTKENNGQKLSMGVGDKITITLPEHSTAGYRWLVAQLDTNVMAKLEDKYLGPKSKNMGASGERKFTLRALNSGNTDVVLEEKRSWETEEKPVSTFEINVLISSK